MNTEHPNDILAAAGLPVGPDAITPFIQVNLAGQCYRWRGDKSRESEILGSAHDQLTKSGFRCHWVTSDKSILHAMKRTETGNHSGHPID